MTDEKYRPTTLDGTLARIAEEASEVAAECQKIIKIVCKSQRFGLNDTNPATGNRNIAELRGALKAIDPEVEDLKMAAADFSQVLSELYEGAVVDA